MLSNEISLLIVTNTAISNSFVSVTIKSYLLGIFAEYFACPKLSLYYLDLM